MDLARVRAARGSSHPSADLMRSQNAATSTSDGPPEHVERLGIVATLEATVGGTKRGIPIPHCYSP